MITLSDELQALTDAANKVLTVRIQHLPQYGGCDALWDKVDRVGRYLANEQRKILDELLRDPEAPRPGQCIDIHPGHPLWREPEPSWLSRVLSKLFC